MKRFLLALLCLTFLVGILGLTACAVVEKDEQTNDGVSIEQTEINDNGELIITYTDGTVVNLGVVVGADGEDGKDLTACEHNYGEWTVEREATCESIGVDIRTCTLCGDIDYAFIEEKGHLYEFGYTLVDTCTERKNIYYCTTCSATKFVNEDQTATHTYENYKCTACGAYEPTPNEYFAFIELPDGTYSVKTRNRATLPAVVVIPSTYKGKAVTAINSKAFDNCGNVTDIIIPDSIASVELNAFDGCDSLTYKVENNLKYLGNSDNPYLYLAGTTSKDITTATVNENCKIIGYEAFDYHLSLASISIPNGVKSICFAAFCCCRSLTEIILPDSITYIDEWAFSECSGLKEIVIPNGVTAIKEGVFRLCSNLAEIVIPAGVTVIDAYAFRACTSLTEIILPDSITRIDIYAFVECDNLKYNVAANLKYLGNTKNPYLCLADKGSENITTAIINGKCKIINAYAFHGCSSLSSVSIPESVSNIGNGAFWECGSLRIIYYNGTMTQWNAIVKGNSWDYKTGEYTVVCTDGNLDKNGNVVA